MSAILWSKRFCTFEKLLILQEFQHIVYLLANRRQLKRMKLLTWCLN